MNAAVPVAAYSLDRNDLDQTTDLEIAFGTTRLLPPYEIVPDEFKHGNIYTRLAEAIFYGRPLPPAEVQFRAGFDDAGPSLQRCTRAHLASFEPGHVEKIAGVGYMISLVCEITETETS